MIKYFVFDLDGTVIDSEPTLLKTWQKAFAVYGTDLSQDVIKTYMGRTMENIVRIAGVKADEHFPEVWMNIYKDFMSDTTMFPGVEEMFDGLLASGCRIGAVTSRDRKEYDNFIKPLGIEKYMDIIVVADDTVKHKPEAEPMLKYMQLAGAQPFECIYIGDMVGDIRCGNSAGVMTGYAAWKEEGLSCDEATVTFNSPMEILNLLN